MRSRGFLLLAGILVATPALAWGAPALDPAQVGWTSIDLSGSKFFISAGSTISLKERAPGQIAASLLVPPQGRPVAPGPAVMEMAYAASLAGQRTHMTLLLDAPSGAALQLEVKDSGRRQRERRWRFTDLGAYHWTRKPANAYQRDLGPAAWTNLTEGMRPYPAEAAGAVITDATALIYVLAAAPLRVAGDRLEILEFSHRQVHRVSAEVLGTMKLAVDYREDRGNAVTRRKKTVSALRIRLRGDAVGPKDEDENFELLGLSGGIELALDPVTRMPLQLSGSAPYVGKVTFRLQSAVLR